MFKCTCFLMFLVALCEPVFSATESREVVDEIMRGVGIKYIISTDRKLPKADREKWERNLAEYVDFETLNQETMRRIREALSELGEEKTELTPEEKAIFERTATSLGKKAVLFLVPKELTNFTLAYLRMKDDIGLIPDCRDAPEPEPKGELILCISDVSNSEIHIRFVSLMSKWNIILVFKKTNTWRLSSIEGVISKETLDLIGRWK